MTWIVQDACVRLWTDIGFYNWRDWRRMAERLDLTVAVVDHGPVPLACIIDDTIIIRGGLSPEVEARVAWHEIGHAVLHAGGREFWGKRPNGTQILNKFERQADEFAELFPSWE